MVPIRILVTGGGRGIGRAIALHFAREGAHVALLARTEAELSAAAADVEQAGGRAWTCPMDQGDPDSIEEAVPQALQHFGGELDVLVNNAGVFDVAPIDAVDPSMWRKLMAVNLTGPFLVTSRCLPALRRSARAHIFNIASTAALQGFAGSSLYCASKAGLMGFGNGLREDLRGDGIRVSTVYPGATDTAIFDGVPGEWDRSTMNRPEDVAQVLWRAYRGEGDQADLEVPPPRLPEAL